MSISFICLLFYMALVGYRFPDRKGTAAYLFYAAFCGLGVVILIKYLLSYFIIGAVISIVMTTLFYFTKSYLYVYDNLEKAKSLLVSTAFTTLIFWPYSLYLLIETVVILEKFKGEKK